MIQIVKDVIHTQHKRSYLVQIGTVAFYFGKKQGWGLELFTPLHWFRFSKPNQKEE